MQRFIRVEPLVKNLISVNKDNIIDKIGNNSKVSRAKFEVKTAKFKNLEKLFLTKSKSKNMV